MHSILTIWKTEFKLSLRTIIIWGLIMAILAILNLAVFDNLADQADSLQAALETLPKELLEVFGIQGDFLTSVPSYFNGNFLTMYVLFNSIFAVSVVSGLISKRIDSGQMTFFFSKPISRAYIFIAKYLTVISAVILSNIVVIGLSYLCCVIFIRTAEVPLPFFITATAAISIFQIMVASLSMFTGVFLSSSLNTFVGTGIVFGLVIYDVLSQVSGLPEFLQYFSPYHYLSLNAIAKDYTLPAQIWILVLVGLIFFTLGLIFFRRREIDI